MTQIQTPRVLLTTPKKTSPNAQTGPDAETSPNAQTTLPIAPTSPDAQRTLPRVLEVKLFTDLCVHHLPKEKF